MNKKQIITQKVQAKISQTETADYSKFLYLKNKEIPFAFINEKGLDSSTRKIIRNYLRKYAKAWINLANK